ncbi:MAG TPA: SulP family inorganic anion transporter [Candidatus Competibacteraceae bacterium]|nr:SulP family inorganic anion transporter [Candidatus Competibacteraceae bacterium]HRZ05888.1 SulP family inorganic anion transporter [Candidatus Competibacteraceae bacterium]HSA46367.1 SulP family inorganic anion transporter [Candidatus Competibacteraceae bacterium]
MISQDFIQRAASTIKIPTALLTDLRGGLVAAAVVLPQATAFGVTVFAPFLGAASGALAGLIGAILLLFISGVVGGAVGVISGPTGPSMALLTGTTVILTASGLPPATLVLALLAVTLLAGLLQLLIALAGGGRLMKFIPYPVIAGLATGTGLLLMQSQIKPLLGLHHQTTWSQWHWLPVTVTVVAFGAARLIPRLLPRIPGPIAGLLAGTALFQLIISSARLPAMPEHWVVGALPALSEFHLTALPREAWLTLPWPVILHAAFALAILSSLNTLLASVLADTTTGLRHNARRELLAQGVGQIAVGLAGGLAGSASVGATATAVQAGARRWAAFTAGLLLLLILLFSGPVGQWLPTSALAGIIIASALNLLETDIIAWARRPRTRLDAVVAVLVAGVTVGYDLMAAVLVGLSIAILLFIRAQSQLPIIHRRLTAIERPSVRQRPSEQAGRLAQHGDRIVMYQLRGTLFFAKTDQLFEEMLPDLDRSAWVILHLRRVMQIDLSSVRLLQQIAARLEAHGGELLFCEVRQDLGLGRDVERTLRKISLRPGRLNVHTFTSADQALEYAENALLNTLGVATTVLERRIDLAEMDLCRDMQPLELAEFAAVLRPRELDSGERLFAAGDGGAELYLVLRGRIDIRLPATVDRYKRLAIYGPGTVFGEIAFLDPGPRAAEAVAVRPTELRVLNRADFNQLRKTHPDAAITLLLALGRLQSQTLRWSAREIQRLIQW